MAPSKQASNKLLLACDCQSGCNCSVSTSFMGMNLRPLNCFTHSPHSLFQSLLDAWWSYVCGCVVVWLCGCPVTKQTFSYSQWIVKAVLPKQSQCKAKQQQQQQPRARNVWRWCSYYNDNEHWFAVQRSTASNILRRGGQKVIKQAALRDRFIANPLHSHFDGCRSVRVSGRERERENENEIDYERERELRGREKESLHEVYKGDHLSTTGCWFHHLCSLPHHFTTATTIIAAITTTIECMHIRSICFFHNLDLDASHACIARNTHRHRHYILRMCPTCLLDTLATLYPYTSAYPFCVWLKWLNKQTLLDTFLFVLFYNFLFVLFTETNHKQCTSVCQFYFWFGDFHL